MGLATEPYRTLHSSKRNETKRNETKAIRYLRRAFRGSDFAESLLSYRRKRLSVVVRSGGGREGGREGVRFCKTRDTMPSNI